LRDVPVARGARGLAYDADQADEPTRRRLLSNRESAARSRRRRVEAEVGAASALARCEAAAAASRAEVAALRAELGALRAALAGVVAAPSATAVGGSGSMAECGVSCPLTELFFAR
jgi:hypothetical protein